MLLMITPLAGYMLIDMPYAALIYACHDITPFLATSPSSFSPALLHAAYCWLMLILPLFRHYAAIDTLSPCRHFISFRR